MCRCAAFDRAFDPSYIAIGTVPTTAIVELEQAQETVDELFRI